jgi:hypothetical protein
VGGVTITLPVPPTPTGLDSTLGFSGWDASYAGFNSTVIPNGPNAGFIYYAAQINFTSFFFQYIIHPDLVDQSSIFSQHQCGSNGYISWADLFAQTKRHEYDSPTQSHWAFYAKSVNDNNPGDDIESRVGSPDSVPTFDNLTAQGLTAIFQRIRQDTAVEPFPVNFSENGQPLGNVNFGPDYAPCN